MSDCRILVVDSDESHASRCTQFLEQQGFEVSVSSDANGACDVLASLAPAAVLIDALIEGGAASVVAAKARENGAVIFGMSDLLLGPTNREIAIRRDGCAEYWDKPVEADLVLGWLRRALGDDFPSLKPIREVSAPAAPQGANTEPDDSTAPAEPWGERPTRVTPMEALAAVTDAVAQLPDAAPGPASAGATRGAIGRAADPSDVPGADAAPMNTSAVSAEAPLHAAMRLATESSETAPPNAAVEAAKGRISKTVAGSPVVATGEERSRRPAGLSVPFELDAELVGRKGDLGSHSLAAIVARLRTDHFTGKLIARRGPVEKTILFSAGEPIAARSSVEDDSLPAILESDGLLRPDQREAIGRNLGAGALDLLSTYVDSGIFEPSDLPALADAILCRRVLEMFDWTSGSFESEHGAIPDHRGSEPTFGGAELIWQGLRFGTPPERRGRWLDRYIDAPLDWVARPPRRDEMRLTRWQRAIIGSIDGVTPGAEVITGVPDRDEALALLCTLLAGGFVAFVR